MGKICRFIAGFPYVGFSRLNAADRPSRAHALAKRPYAPTLRLFLLTQRLLRSSIYVTFRIERSPKIDLGFFRAHHFDVQAEGKETHHGQARFAFSERHLGRHCH